MNRTKLWISTFNFGSVKAGPVIRFMRYAPHFKEAGFDPVFLTKKRDDEDVETVSEDFEVEYITCSDSRELNQQVVLRAMSEPDLAAVLFFEVNIPNLKTYREARKRGVNMIYVSTMQLELDTKLNGEKRSWFNKLAIKTLLRLCFRQMNHIVSSSSLLNSDFTQLGINSSKLNIINNGVDTDKFKPLSTEDKRALRAELNLPKDGFIFLYVGLFIDRKGVLELMESIDSMPNTSQPFKLLMVGHEMPGLAENRDHFDTLWETVKQRELTNGRLIIHPFSSHVQKYYQAADAFVFRSKLEGMPNVLLESMASGLPTCTYKFKGFSEDFGREGVTYLALHENAEANGKLFAELLENTQRTATLGTSARNWALSEFALSESIRRYATLFKS